MSETERGLRLRKRANGDGDGDGDGDGMGTAVLAEDRRTTRAAVPSKGVSGVSKAAIMSSMSASKIGS